MSLASITRVRAGHRFDRLEKAGEGMGSRADELWSAHLHLDSKQVLSFGHAQSAKELFRLGSVLVLKKRASEGSAASSNKVIIISAVCSRLVRWMSSVTPRSIALSIGHEPHCWRVG
jgi:hypothetical protein